MSTIAGNLPASKCNRSDPLAHPPATENAGAAPCCTSGRKVSKPVGACRVPDVDRERMAAPRFTGYEAAIFDIGAERRLFMRSISEDSWLRPNSRIKPERVNLKSVVRQTKTDEEDA